MPESMLVCSFEGVKPGIGLDRFGNFASYVSTLLLLPIQSLREAARV